MKRTISAMVGKGSVNHNSRKFKAANVDGERSHLNIDYCNDDIKMVYHKLFDEALERYNAKQTRSDRCIENYYEKIRSGKQEKPFHEIILQIGDKDNMSALTNDGQLAKKILDEYYQSFQDRNPNLRVFSVHLHMDEATPHLHIDFVPFTTGSKRGLDTRVSLKQALAVQGFKGGTRGDTEWNQWVQSEKEQLAAVMERHGIEWEHKGTHEKHLSVLDYEKKMRAEEIEQLNKEKAIAEKEAKKVQARIDDLAPKLKSIEQLAADFSDDPERLLPEVAALETAKAYREKKAKPILEKAVKVLRAVYHSYLNVKNKLEKLQRSHDLMSGKNIQLSVRIGELVEENKQLKSEVADFERVKKVFGYMSIQEEIQRVKDQENRQRLHMHRYTQNER